MTRLDVNLELIYNQKIDFGMAAKSLGSCYTLIPKSQWLRAGDDRGRKWMHLPSGWEVSQ